MQYASLGKKTYEVSLHASFHSLPLLSDPSLSHQLIYLPHPEIHIVIPLSLLYLQNIQLNTDQVMSTNYQLKFCFIVVRVLMA